MIPSDSAFIAVEQPGKPAGSYFEAQRLWHGLTQPTAAAAHEVRCLASNAPVCCCAGGPGLSYSFFLDDILFFFEPVGAAGDYAPTDDHALGHIALSVADLATWRARVSEQQIAVVAEPAMSHGFMSFFIRGPDGALIELVQAAPDAELCPLQ